MVRRTYGAGSLYQRADGRWIGAFQAGWTNKGTRRRVTVSAKTRAEAARKLRDRLRQFQNTGDTSGDPRTTVKTWSEQWLADTQHVIRPGTWDSHKASVTQWIVPAIGHKRLSALTQGDVRAVHQAFRDRGMSPGTMLRGHAVLTTMLKAALDAELPVPDAVFRVKRPRLGDTDRSDIPLPDVIELLRVASQLEDGSRWLFQFLYGTRQGETLGLCWDRIDFERGTVDLAEQLQRLPWADKAAGMFRVPDGYTYRQVHHSWCLVKLKTEKSERLVPLIPHVAAALQHWRAIAPDNPAGLVWPRPNGAPRNATDDAAAFSALQDTAGVVRPGEPRRHYYGHETRHTAATLLLALDVPPKVIMEILGHTKLDTTHRYQHADIAMMRKAIEAAGERLQLG